MLNELHLMKLTFHFHLNHKNIYISKAINNKYNVKVANRVKTRTVILSMAYTCKINLSSKLINISLEISESTGLFFNNLDFNITFFDKLNLNN